MRKILKSCLLYICLKRGPSPLMKTNLSLYSSRLLFLFLILRCDDWFFSCLWSTIQQSFVDGIYKNQRSNCQHPLDHRQIKCFRKTSISALLTMPKPSTVWITINCGKLWKRWEYQTTWPASWETCMQVRKQQLELDMEQHTGSK